MSIKISLITETDVPFATELTTRERWGHLPTDFSRLLYFDPQGSFLARIEDKNVGIISTVSHGDYAFMGNLIINHEYRGQGIGYALMKHAIEYLDGKGMKTIELDGVFSAVSMYRKFGFKDKYLSLRFFRRAGHFEVNSFGIIKKPANEITEYDRAKTGLERGKALLRFLEEFDRTVYCAGVESISGYAIVRKREGDTSLIAPVIADDIKTARSLLSNIVSNHSLQTLTIGIPENNRSAVALVHSLGFAYMAPSLRMYRGQMKFYEKNAFGILGPDLG